MILFLLLSGVTWLLIFIVLYDLIERGKFVASLREIFLISTFCLGILITAFTEGLSLFQLLTHTAIKICWALVLIGLIGRILFLLKQDASSIQGLGTRIADSFKSFSSQSWQYHLIFALIVVELIALLVIIQLYPVPNNGDSMRFDFASIMAWEQQASVKHFATNLIAQITFPPFDQYTLLNIYFLTGTDHLSRIVQWFAFLVCLVAVADVAKTLGATPKQELIASLLAATIPMAILQATSDQNGLVVSAWLISFFAFGLKFQENPRNTLWIISTGMALGLAFFSKSTAFIYALPFSIWIGIGVVSKLGVRLQLWKALAILSCIILLINLGHFTRNIITFKNPLGNYTGTVNEIFSVRALASNLIKDVQLQFPLVDSQFQPLNVLSSKINTLASRIHDLTGLDYNDPRTTFNASDNFPSLQGLSTSEKFAGSFVLLILIVITSVLSFYHLKFDRKFQFFLVLLATLLLFAFLLKTQKTTNRLLLPYTIFWTPLISTITFPALRKSWFLIPAAIWCLSLPWLLNNQNRPLISGRDDQYANWPREGTQAYFIRQPWLYPILEQATDLIIENGCTEVGIKSRNFLEYPFWMMLREKGFNGTIKHVQVSNESQIYEDPLYSPCAIFVFEQPINLEPGYIPIEIPPWDVTIYIKN